MRSVGGTSSCPRASRRQVRADRRRIRRRALETPRATNPLPTRRTQRAGARAWWRGTWDTRLSLCRRSGLELVMAFLADVFEDGYGRLQNLLESICGDYANLKFSG